jgi:epoxyqueuosine reductase
MSIKRRILFSIMNRIAIPQFTGLTDMENAMARQPNIILPVDVSPERFDIPLEMMRRVKSNYELPIHSLPPMRILPSLMRNMKTAITSIQQNPQSPRTTAGPDFIHELEGYAHSLGISLIGYTKLPPSLIFKNKGITHDNAIVLAMEMDWDKIEACPSRPTQIMIMETYDALGIAANKIARFLRDSGFSAMAGHPLGGQVLYPPLAQIAGLGWIGKSGLLITENYGPRVRLASVFTSIENLPFNQENVHAWVREYCDSCGACIRECPPKAILEEPIANASGRLTHINLELCFPCFVENYGCSICIKVCPFNRHAYLDLKNSFRKQE